MKWTDDEWPVLDTAGGEVYRAHTNTRLRSDDFESEKLDWQWCFIGMDSPGDYRLSDGCVTIAGSRDRLRALTAIASDADYEVVTEIETEGDVETGLVLLYNEAIYAGIGLVDGILQGRWNGKPTWSKVEAKDCRFLKLKVDNYTVSLAYSADGENWLGYPHGFDVSGYHTNTFGGFHSVKPSVICKGEGLVRIKSISFNYDIK